MKRFIGKVKRVKNILLEIEKSQKDPLIAHIDQLNMQVRVIKDELMKSETKIADTQLTLNEVEYEFLRFSDISKLLLTQKEIDWRLECEREIAIDSADHLHPRGVKTDETRSPSFVQATVNYFSRPIAYLDLGCAGGGLVYDFILEDCKAVGIEGSDYSQKRRRAYWREIPWALFTADATYPFQLFVGNSPARFDVIGAWEFFEHISEDDIPKVLTNVKKHLFDRSSLFLANIATFADHDGDTHYHQTIQNYDWWKNVFEKNGFEVVPYPFDLKLNPRGAGNKLGTWQGDYDIKVDP
jgi:2-polyprenyl-3-methyl-5-hydroxy-6-metoxy-1,4-benzoquinol methylase